MCRGWKSKHESRSPILNLTKKTSSHAPFPFTITVAYHSPATLSRTGSWGKFEKHSSFRVATTLSQNVVNSSKRYHKKSWPGVVIRICNYLGQSYVCWNDMSYTKTSVRMCWLYGNCIIVFRSTCNSLCGYIHLKLLIITGEHMTQSTVNFSYF